MQIIRLPGTVNIQSSVEIVAVVHESSVGAATSSQRPFMKGIVYETNPNPACFYFGFGNTKTISNKVDVPYIPHLGKTAMFASGLMLIQSIQETHLLNASPVGVSSRSLQF